MPSSSSPRRPAGSYVTGETLAKLTLRLLAPRYALCRLASGDAIPAWTSEARTFLTISRTPDELSIVADEEAVPPELDAARGYRALRVEGPMPLDLVGVMAAIAEPLAAARVPIFPIATCDTDYILVLDAHLAESVAALEAAGHSVIRRNPSPDAR